MLTKKIKYEDFDGNQREEEWNFHLNKSELVEIQADLGGGIENYLKRIAGEQNGKAMLDIYTMFIKRSVGRKSDDGKHFRKSPEILEDFMSTNAYEVLFEELADPERFKAFLLGIIPKDAREAFEKQEAAGLLK